MKKFLFLIVFVLALTFGASQTFAQGCSVTGISIATSGTSSSNCFVPAGQTISYNITGTWVGTGNVYFSLNGGVSWTSALSFTINVAGIIPAKTANALYRVTFDTRTSGTMTGTLLGLNPLPGRRIMENIGIGNVAYGSLGTSTTTVAGTFYCTDVPVSRAMTITDIFVLAGTLSPMDNWLAALYDGSGNLLGNSATAGQATASSNTFQDFALLTNVSVQAGLYFACVQSNGTTDAVRLLAASTYVSPETTNFTGVFGTVPTTMTVPTTFTALKGPVVYLKGF